VCPPFFKIVLVPCGELLSPPSAFLHNPRGVPLWVHVFDFPALSDSDSTHRSFCLIFRAFFSLRLSIFKVWLRLLYVDLTMAFDVPSRRVFPPSPPPPLFSPYDL